jgi:hypothetical protein
MPYSKEKLYCGGDKIGNHATGRKYAASEACVCHG